MTRFILILLYFPLFSHAQGGLRFNNIDSLFAYAEKNSAVLKTNEQQVILAKYQKIAALANSINFRNQVGFTMTDNTQLPVSFIPAQLLGGPAGTFKQLTLGQQYVSNFNLAPQIDIINPGAWARIKSASISQELTAINNLLNKKSLYESIAACYFNITSLQEQLTIAQKNVTAADTLLLIMKDKYTQGLVRQQDVNDAVVNKLTLEDRQQQLQVSLEQQYNSLRILCDVPENTAISILDELNYNQQFNASLNAGSQLQYQSSRLQMESAMADLRYNRLANLPVLSALYSHSYYQNSNSRFFDNNPNAQWLNSAYFGAKLTFFLPDVNQLVFAKNAYINYKIASIHKEHDQLQNDINNNQLQLDYQKAYSQFTTTRQVFLLKEENYRMAFNQYSQSILPSDKLLIAFNDMLASRLNYSSALAGLLYTKAKIDINNTIK